MKTLAECIDEQLDLCGPYFFFAEEIFNADLESKTTVTRRLHADQRERFITEYMLVAEPPRPGCCPIVEYVG